MSSDEDRMRDMVDHLAKVEAHRPASLEELEGDEVLSAAFIRWIEIVGEAASHISQETRDALTEVPWREIIAMRNRLIHAYPDVNLALVWGVVETAGPGLRALIQAHLDDDLDVAEEE